MSRLTYAKRHPRRTLAAFASVLVAAGVALGSGATFSAGSANPSNTFSSGALTVGNSNDGTAIFQSQSGWYPGDSAPGTVDIANTGTTAGDFTLSSHATSDSGPNAATTPLSGALHLVVADCGLFTGTTPPDCTTPTTVYDGPAVISTPVNLGAPDPLTPSTPTVETYQVGDKHRYQLTLSYPSQGGANDLNYQGESTTLEYDWNAAQH